MGEDDVMLRLLCGWLLCLSLVVPAQAGSRDVQCDHLLQLLHERLHVAEAVAQAKWNSGATIEDAVREQRVLEVFASRATEAGLNPSDAVHFMRAQIEASKWRQQDWFRRWQLSGQGVFENPPHLQHDIRPALDALSDHLIAALAALAPLDGQALSGLQARARSLWGELDGAQERMLQGWVVGRLQSSDAVAE